MKKLLLLSFVFALAQVSSLAQQAPIFSLSLNVTANKSIGYDHNMALFASTSTFDAGLFLDMSTDYGVQSYSLSKDGINLGTNTFDSGQNSFSGTLHHLTQTISAPSDASSFLIGNYLIHGTTNVGSFDYAFTINPFSVPDFGHSQILSDPAALMSNLTKQITWTNGVSSPDFTGSFYGNGAIKGSGSWSPSNNTPGATPTSGLINEIMNPTQFFYVGAYSGIDLNALLPNTITITSNSSELNPLIRIQEMSLAFVSVEGGDGAPPVGTLTPVPEPSTYGLLGAGALAGVAFLRRRRRAS